MITFIGIVLIAWGLFSRGGCLALILGVILLLV